MILAAGYGKRMRPLTDTTPKPLLPVADKPLLLYHIERLRALGVTQLVINVAHLGEQIMALLGEGSDYGVNIDYSIEPYPLETGGSIARALPLLGELPFLLVNGDIWTDYPFQRLLQAGLAPGSLGRLVLVANPQHNQCGDFTLDGDMLQPNSGATSGYTFSGVSLLRPALIAQYSRRREVFPLREALTEALQQQRLSAEVYYGEWWDVGTPERLQLLDARLRGLAADPGAPITGA